MSISFPEGGYFPVAMVASDIAGNPIDLTGATVVRVKVYYRPREGAAALKTYNIGTGITVAVGTAGHFTLTIAAGDLYEGEYSFDCYAVLADTSIVPIGRGEIDVTHFDTLEV